MIEYQIIDSLADVEALEFAGSPTVLIDGREPFAEPGAVPALACLVYRTPDCLAGSPTTEQRRDALTHRQLDERL